MEEHRTEKGTTVRVVWELLPLTTVQEGHSIELIHDLFVGSRTVIVDSEVIHKSRNFFDNGSVHHFMLYDGLVSRCSIIIAPAGIGFTYKLEIAEDDGQNDNETIKLDHDGYRRF